MDFILFLSGKCAADSSDDCKAGSIIDFEIMVDFCHCSRRLCGGEDVPFWRARKQPKSAQRGLKSRLAPSSAPSGLPPLLPFLAGKSSGGCPACRHFPCAVFRVENTKFALVCAKRDSGTGTHAFSRLFAVLCILRQRVLRHRTVNTAL